MDEVLALAAGTRVLIGNHSSIKVRVATILAHVVVVTCVPLACVYLASRVGLAEWPPQSSSPFGVLAGTLVGLIVVFEMLLAPRKWLRGYRLVAAQVWMRWHIRLGLVSLPLVLIHSGFNAGGVLPATTLALFVAVFVSGVWGLILQQWIPTLLLNDVPEETIQLETGALLRRQALEAERLVASLVDAPHAGGPRPLSEEAAREFSRFGNDVLLPYLRGDAAKSPFASPAQGTRLLAAVRTGLPASTHPTVDRLGQLIGLRQQWVRQSRLQFWLHNWLLVHLPLSVAMTMLMALHAVRALKYW